VESNSPDFLCSKRNEHLERRPQSEKWCCWLAAVVCICIYLHLQLQLQTATPAPFRFVQSALPLCRHKQPPPSIFVLCSPVLCSPVLSCPVLSYPLSSFALPCQVARESSPGKISNRAISADTDITKILRRPNHQHKSTSPHYTQLKASQVLQ
jgi:hypothetical protein